MRRASGIVVALVAGCGFGAPGTAATDGDVIRIDADAVPARCGDGVVDTGEVCDPGVAAACTTSCGDIGTGTCGADCSAITACAVTFEPERAWEISETGAAWASVSLPFTAIACDQCSRFFRTTVCDTPARVDFAYASDNAARMVVNAGVAFDEFFLDNYCSDEPCCAKCCDTADHCRAGLTPPLALDAQALSRFRAGPNEVIWELREEGGGAGFYTTMTVTY